MATQLRSTVLYESRAAQFDYNRTQPLDLQEAGLEYRDGIAIHDVSYAGVASDRIHAFLLTPVAEGRFPGVIFVHPAPGNRQTFLDEAVQLAQRGAASLLIDAPWARGEAWGRTQGEPEHDLQEHVRTAQDLRRAIDLLSARPEVAAERLAYVGHSLGALFGGILAGLERRLKACILMTGAGSFAEVAALNLAQLHGTALDRYREVLAPIEPRYYVQFAAPAPLMFQFGFKDHSFPRERFIEFAAASSEPKAIKWYCADHFLADPDATQDRLEWLRVQLDLPW